MNEAEIQADYRRKIALAEQTAKDLLTTRIAQLKKERGQALANLKTEADHGEAQKETPAPE